MRPFDFGAIALRVLKSPPAAPQELPNLTVALFGAIGRTGKFVVESLLLGAVVVGFDVAMTVLQGNHDRLDGAHHQCRDAHNEDRPDNHVDPHGWGECQVNPKR